MLLVVPCKLLLKIRIRVIYLINKTNEVRKISLLSYTKIFWIFQVD
jgi:hypothetical protein